MSETNQTISLFLPSFFALPESVRTSLNSSALPLLLGRGQQQRGVSGGDWHESVWRLMGLAESVSQDVPVAALRLLGAGKTIEGGTYCCADPVHISPNRDHLLLMGNETMVVDEKQAQSLVEELNRFFAEDGLVLTALSPKQWVWHSTTLAPLHCCPLSEAVGRNVRDCMPQGEGASDWNRVVTEAQMLLHGSAINVDRRGLGQREINSLWLWGMGELPDTMPGRFSQIYGNDLYLAGLVKVTESQYQPLPSDATKVIASLRSEDNALLVIDFSPQHPLEQQLSSLEQDWLLPLIEGLKRGDYQRLTLELGNGVAITATTKELKRFWKRRRSLDMLES